MALRDFEGGGILTYNALKSPKEGSSGLHVEVWPADDVPRDVYSRWIIFLSASDGPCPALQAPASIKVAAAINPAATFHVVVVKELGGEIIGIQPVQRGSLSVRFNTGNRNWLTVSFPGVSLIGTEPLVSRADLKPLIMCSLLNFFRDEMCVEMKELKADDDINDVVFYFARHRRQLYRIGNQGPWRFAHVPKSIGVYQDSLGKKKAYNLRRQNRLLEEHFGGEIKLTVVRDVGDLHSVIDAIYQITGWPLSMLRWAARDADLSCKEGIACFFIVKCNSQLIGLVRAVAYGDVLYVHSIHHNPAIERLSPGTVAWQTAVRWIIESETYKRIVFAYGDPARGNKPTSVAEDRARVFIYHGDAWTSSVLGAHRLFVACKQLGSRLIRMRAIAAVKGSVDS